MLTLHLGVSELPYPDDRDGTTTGDVAEFLERKYHVMEVFYNEHEQDVADALAEGMKDVLEAVIMGASPPADPFLAGTSEIEHLFQRFIESGEMETLGYPGVPTQAALEGRSLRFKAKRGPSRRVSFYDTGLYVSSFKAWIEDWARLAASAYQGAW